MADPGVVLVLNAGSSSLKFCIYPADRIDSSGLIARGQIEGIGTAPRLSARDGAGTVLASESLDRSVADGRAATDALAGWLRAHYGGTRVAGVGHRVVHGGAQYAGPAIVTRQVLQDLRSLISLAPRKPR